WRSCGLCRNSRMWRATSRAGAERSTYTSTRMAGNRYSGQTHCYLGEFAAARDFLDRGLSLYNPTQRSAYAAFEIGDSRIQMLSYQSWASMCLGYLDQARMQQDAAVTAARQLAHAFTLALALWHSCLGQWGGHSARAVLPALEELIGLATEHGF